MLGQDEGSEGTGGGFDAEAFLQARDALVDVVRPEDRKTVLIAFDNLVEIHRAGRVRMSNIAGPTTILKKAMREAWVSGVIAPLARSRDTRVRSLLSILPDSQPLTGHHVMSMAIMEAATSVNAEAPGVVAHLARARAYLDAVPVILSALDGLAGMPRVFVRDDAPPKSTFLASYAQRRLRDTFARAVVPLCRHVAETARGGSLACVGSRDIPQTASVLARVPGSDVPRRDPAWDDWADRLGDALVGDVVRTKAAPLAKDLFNRHPGISIMADPAVERIGDLGTRLSFDLGYGPAVLTVAYALDLAAGSLAMEMSGAGHDGRSVAVSPERVDGFLGSGRPTARRKGTGTGRAAG